jgi:hypothetical protein
MHHRHHGHFIFPQQQGQHQAVPEHSIPQPADYAKQPANKSETVGPVKAKA